MKDTPRESLRKLLNAKLFYFGPAAVDYLNTGAETNALPWPDWVEREIQANAGFIGAAGCELLREWVATVK